jgi:hypothetical protein
VSAGRDVTGTVTVRGDLAVMTVDGSLPNGGGVSVGGRLGALTVAGAAAGSIAAQLVGTVAVAAAAPVDGEVLTVTQAGVPRTIQALHMTSAPLAGVRMTVLYDGQAGPAPQAAVRVANADLSAGAYDLVLLAPTRGGVRPVAARRGRRGGHRRPQRGRRRQHPRRGHRRPAGVLPVPGRRRAGGEVGRQQEEARGDGRPAAGGRGGAAGRRARRGGRPGRPAGRQRLGRQRPRDRVRHADRRPNVRHGAFEVSKRSAASKRSLLASALAVDPATRKPRTVVVPAAGVPLRAIAGQGGRVGLFAGAAGAFEPRGLLLADQSADGANVTALAEWGGGRPSQAAVELLRFEGDGGSVDTFNVVRNITSTGLLGDVLLRAGRRGGQVLQSVSAPGMSGSVKLFNGGRLIGPLP